MNARALPDLQTSGARPQVNGVAQRQATAAPVSPAQPGDVGELCDRFASVCESAVDPLEISSALEFEGFGDQAVQKRYGVADVFTLAEEMYRRVPRRPAEPEPLADPWRASKFRPALHGLLYALPTVCFPAAGGLLSGPGALRILIVALLSSWTMSQGLAYLGYLRLGQAGLGQAQRVLRVGLAAGLVGVDLAFAAAALLMPVPVPALIFGFGMAAYMLGASVLLVLGAERLLFVVLAPAVVGSVAFMALGRPPHLEHATWGALAATPLLALVLAVACTSRGARIPGHGQPAKRSEAAGPLLAAADLRGALPSAGWGLVAAGLLVFPVVVNRNGHGGVDAGVLLASLPLTLSMGAAEWLLLWYRRRTQGLLRGTRELRAFASRARLVLFAALLQYLATVVLLTIAVVIVAGRTGLVHLQRADLPQVAAYLTLGGVMFLALLLQAFGSRMFPLIACAVALGFEIGYRGFGVAGQIVACTELIIVLAGYAALVLGRAVRHSC